MPSRVLELNFNESRRVFPAITMLETGNWAVPVLEGKEYFKKPPMINWMIASSMLVFGKNEFAVRFPSALSILLFALLLILLDSKFLDTETRFVSAMIFITSFGIIGKGLVCEIESAYICLTGAAMVSWLALYSRDFEGWQLWLLPYFFLGLCLLVKGPLALLFFYAMVFAILYSQREIRKLFTWGHLLGILIMLGIFFLWAYRIVAPSQSPGGEKAAGTWISEMLLQLRSGRVSPILWFRRVMGSIANFAPWIAFAYLFVKPSRLIKDQKQLGVLKASLISILICLALVNAMPGTKARYSMPLIPLASILTGFLLTKIPTKNLALKFWQTLNTVIIGIFSFACASALLLCVVIATFQNRFAKIFLQNKAAEKIFSVIISADSKFYFFFSLIFCVSMIILILFAKFASYENKFISARKLIVHFGVILALASFAFYSASPFINAFDTQRPAARVIDSFVPQGETLNVLRIGIEPFFFYMKSDYKKFNDIVLPLSAGFYLCKSEDFDNFFGPKSNIIQRAEFQDGSHKYIIIELNPSTVRSRILFQPFAFPAPFAGLLRERSRRHVREWCGRGGGTLDVYQARTSWCETRFQPENI
ncbi:MAG: glycosyltransferase family 39 protein [Candidatus Nanoarchaeia archaeon]